MYKTIYPAADATLYSMYSDKNTGLDQILELGKIAIGEPIVEGDSTVYYDATQNSRILIKFDISDISASIVSGKITSPFYYLTLKSAHTLNLPTDYTIYAYPVSGSWKVGRGYFNNNPSITEGVSWKYTNSKLEGTQWLTSSYAAGSTGSYSLTSGGGNWYPAYSASQTFSYSNADIRMDVTNIVNAWVQGSIRNDGFILKFSDTVEQDLSQISSIQLFSMDSHTIFVPRLEVYWNDSNNSGTSSFSEIPSDDFVLYLKNIRDSYAEEERPRVRLGVREKYPVATYSTSSNYLISKRLPVKSMYQIQDVVTDDVIIPFHPSGTLINCDTEGNWFRFDCNSLMPERYYKFVFKSEFDGGDTVRITDDNFMFKIRRN
jgi:hypothetical protein